MSETSEFNDMARAYLSGRSGKWEAPPSAPVGSDGQPMFCLMGALMATVDEASGDVQLSPVPERKMADIQGDMRTLIASLAYDPFGEIGDRAIALLGEAYDVGLDEGSDV